jgi:predicted DNA-binding transcriptional regulator AlpA
MDDALDIETLDVPEVLAATHLRTPTIRKMRCAGTFPAPFRVGKRRIAWMRSGIERWLAARPRG